MANWRNNDDDDPYFAEDDEVMFIPLGNTKSSAPWIPASSGLSRVGILGLHEELVLLSEWLVPTRAEKYVNEYLATELWRIARKQWPGVTMELIGSSSTGLRLPASDIDVVMFGGWRIEPLKTLEIMLNDAGFADPAHTIAVETARVPVLKVTHLMSRSKLDISFNQIDGVSTSEILARFKRKFPKFPLLYMVLKRLVSRRGLNEVYTGGISSFSMALLVVFFLQQQRTAQVPERKNLGVLLLEMFEYFAHKFDFRKYGIDALTGELVRKQIPSGVLYIVNPIKPNENIASATNSFPILLGSFKWIFAELHTSVLRGNNGGIQQGILGKLLGFTEEELKGRELHERLFCRRVFGPV